MIEPDHSQQWWVHCSYGIYMNIVNDSTYKSSFKQK